MFVCLDLVQRRVPVPPLFCQLLREIRASLFGEVCCLISDSPLPPRGVTLIPASHDAAFPFKVKAAKPKLPSDNPDTDDTSSEEMLADGKAKEER